MNKYAKCKANLHYKSTGIVENSEEGWEGVDKVPKGSQTFNDKRILADFLP